MNLILEIGNTTTKLAIFDGDKLMKFHRVENHQFDNSILSPYKINKAILAGSGDLNSVIWEQIQAEEKIVFDKEMISSLKIKYKTPNTVGQDRLINAHYASSLYPLQNNLIIDVGTCITFSFVNADSEFLGGSISPGLNMRLRSLHEYTDKLPLIDIEDPDTLIGNSTSESILSGVVLGSAYEINQRIEAYRAIYPDLNIIMTGGDTLFFENKINCQIFAEPHFTLNGLNDILNRP